MKPQNTLKRCLGAWRGASRLSMVAAASLAAFAATADAAKIVWQSSVDSLAGQEFIDLLEAAGHEVTVLNTGTPSAEEIAMINDHDLVVFSRKNTSGNFDGEANQYWDTDITIPAIAMSAYLVRDNRLRWVQGNDLTDDTPADVSVDTGHPVWVCVESGPWHTAVDRGTTFNISALVEPGVLIASATGAGDTTESIVAEWPTGTIAAGPRMLFNAGARELDGSPIADAGAYNLTPSGERAFLNAVAYMAFLSGNVSKPAGSTVYHQDFTAPDGTTDLQDGSQILANAESTPFTNVQGGALRLTDATQGGSLAAFRTPALPDLSGGFVASFDFALSGGGDRPADGFSFNLGTLPADAGGGEGGFPGATDTLRVSFDTWDNEPAAEEGLPGVGFDIYVNATHLAACRLQAGETRWNNNAAYRFNGQSRPAWIQWKDGLLDLWVDGVEIFSGVDTGAWVPNGIVGFSARTGGATETLVIDNVEIAACTTISTVSEFGLGGDAPAIINTTGFGDDALTFADRVHEHNAAQFNEAGTLAVDGVNTVPLPAYLVGNQYVQFANNAREQLDYFATVTASHPTSWYLLVDNRADGPAGTTGSPNTTDPVLGGTLQWVLDGGWQRVNTGISPNGQDDYTGVDEGGNGDLNQFYSVYTLPYPTNSVTVRNIGAGGNMISLVAAKGFDGTVGEPGPILLDFGSSGPNANGSATGWTAVNNLVQDVPLSIFPGITITALEDGFNPNNTAAPGTGASFNGIDVPPTVFDDYLFKIVDTAGTSAQMRIDGLPAATYAVTVFEGRTTDAEQFGKIWAGSEPADENTGSFAGGGATVIVSVGTGEALHYRHLEDGSGGISGMIIQPVEDFTELWVLGDPTNGNQSEFSQEMGMDTAPGSPTAQDDDFYFWGIYPDPIGTVLDNEPFINFDRAHTPGDPFNRIHFNLDAASAAPDTLLRVTVALCCLGAAEGITSEHDLVFRLNGIDFHSEMGLTTDVLIEEVLRAGDYGVVEGANTIEIERTGGAESSWVQYDYVRLEATAGEPVPQPSALNGLVIHYEFEQAPSDVVENTADGFGDVLADSGADWVGTDEQGANGWSYGYRQLPGDGSGTVDYDPGTEFIPFPAGWWNGSAWDEPNADTDNVPWTTLAQDSSHPNGPNSTDATPGALDPAPASGNYEHWAVRRWVSDYAGTAKIGYSVAKQNVGCGNGITGAVHINGVRQSSTVIPFNDGTGLTNYIEVELAEGDIVDLIHSPVGTDGVSADSCDGGLLSMTISTPATGTPGTLLRIDPATAFVTGTDSPSLGGGGAMFFNEGTGAALGSYIDTNSLFSELGVFDENYTMMAWVNQTEVGGDKMIFGQTTAPALHNGARDNNYYQAHWGDDLNAGTGEVPSHLNEWTHLAFVYDGNQTIYVNGEPIATRDANNLQLDENLLIGLTILGDDRDFSGFLDDVRVYRGALTSAEIQAVAGIEFADSLKVHYAFEEGSGETVVNRAVGSPNGTFLRGGLVEDNLVTDQNSPSGGNAMFFNTGTGDGAGAYIDTGLTPSTANVAGAYTMMAWAKQTEQDGDKLIFGQPSGEALHLGGRNTTYLQGHWGDDNQTGGGAVALNEWTHLAFIYDGDTQTILKNGQVIAQRSGASDIKEDTALLIGLAQLAENRDFSGWLDDVRIYCEALPFDAVTSIVGFGEDADGDGLEDIWERINFGTTDRDGTGDADGDRVNDAAEFANGTDPNSRDTDGDSLWDGTELYATYTNPLTGDTDGDGLDDRFEFFVLGTDPNSDDTDRDGVTDGAELAAATVTYDFNADPAAFLTATGNAEWRATGGVGDSGYIVLTDAANSQNGIVTFADITGGAAVRAIDFRADLRIGDGTCCGDPAGAQPADGMSINFVPVGTTPTFPNANEEGTAEGLAIAFDAWDSGAELDPLGPSITVRYNGTVVTEFDTNTMNGSVSDPNSIQTGPLGGLDWAPVRVTLSPDGAITVNWKGVTIIDNVPTPYVPGPVQIVMAARTGGANENHHVDNVSVALIRDGSPDPLSFNDYNLAGFKKIDYDFEAPQLTEGIVAHWSLDSTLDDAIGDSHGTLMGGSDGDPTYVEGRVGMAVELDGIGEFIEINPANEALFDGTGEDGFTVAIWTKANAFDKNWQALVAKGEQNRWRVHRRSDTNVLTGNGGSADVSQGTTAIDDNEWHHVVLSSNPGVGVTLYVDGAVEGTAGPPTVQNNDLPMMIGENPDARGRTWNGVVDEVTFWSRSLDGADVAQLYNGGAGLDVLTAPADTYSTVVGNTGSAGPGALVVPDGTDLSTLFVDGQLVLTGIPTNDPNAVYVDTQNSSDALGVNGGAARYTMLARVRPDSVAGDNMIFGQLGGDALHNGLRGNQAHFGHWGSDSNSGSTTLTTGEWYDLAFRFDGTIQSIYVNGTKVSSSVQPRGLNNPMNVIVGGSREDRAFEGAIEGVQIYCEAFSDEVVVELQGFGEPASNELLVHYEFEDGITPVVRNLGNKGAPDGTVNATNLIGAFSIGSPSKGGQGAMFFDSTNGDPGETFISTGMTPAEAGIMGQPYTMMAWAQPIQQANGDRMIFGQANGDTGAALHNGIRDGRQHMGHWGDDLNAGGVTVNWNTWEHYAYIWDGTEMKIYVNGELRAQEVHGGLVNSAAELIIGATLPNTEDRDFIGYLDDIRIYCGVLDAAQISSIAGIEDTDGDGLIDAFERAFFGGDLTVASADGDNDGDGISNADEIAQGLNPALADTDGDCWADNLELAYDTDPLDFNDFPDIFAESDSPAAVWSIRTVQITEAAGDINNLATVDMVLNGDLEILADGVQTSKVINISDGSYGNFQPDETIEAFAAGGDDHVTHVTGYFYMNIPGVITFNSASDDGARLRIDGVDVIVDDVLHGTRNSIENGLPGTIELAAGLHQLDYVAWERGGGYSAELSVPLIVGAFPTFASSPCGWELIPPVDPAEFSTEVVISGNFVANRNGAAEGTVMEPAETTGVIPVSNWNNLGPAAAQSATVFDLDLNADPAAFVTFGGMAVWRGTGGVDDSGYISITDNVNGQNNTVTFADGIGGATVHSIEFSADLRIGDGTTRPADGMSINFVPAGSAPTFEGGAGENGTEQGLAIYFDAWDNDDAGDADIVAIGVKYNNVVLAEVPALTPNGTVDDATSIQTGPLGEIGWAPVGISLKPDGTISVKWKGTTLIDAVQTGFEPGPVQLVMGARTGGANQNHHVDNIQIAVGTNPALVDSSGGGTPVQVSWAANTMWTTFNPPANTATAHMMNGYIDDTAAGDDVNAYSHIAFDCIPYPVYDIYIYFTSDGNERTGEARMNGEEAVFLSTNGNNDPITFDKATGADEASANPATYAVWRGLTGPSALFEWRRISNNVGVAGFQIVGQRDLPIPGLLAYWNFDDASNATQSVDLVGGNVGTLMGGAAFTADGEGARGGVGDRALDLGTDSALQRMDVNGDFLAPLGESNALTVSFWQRNNVANGSSFWAVGPGFDRAFQGHTPWGDSNIYFDNSGGCCNDRLSGMAPEGHDYTMWSHYAFVKKPSGEKEVWVNGVLAFAGTNPSALPSEYTSLWIGSGANGDISVQGAMDDVSIWSRALPPETIAELAAGAVPTDLYNSYESVVLNDGPVAYWRMEDSVADATGGTAGTNNGITFAEGQIGQAALFDAAAPGDAYIGFTPGEGGLAQLTNIDEGSPPDANKATSVEFWINTTQVGGADNWRTPLVFGHESPGDGDIQWGFLRPDGKIGFINNDADHGVHETSAPINDGEWHHVVMTYDWASGTSQIYVNGAFDSERTGGTNRYHDLDGRVQAMGYNPAAGDPAAMSQFQGMLDEVAIYDQILSPSRIALHYGVGSPGLGQRNYVEIGGIVDSDRDGVSDILEAVAGTDADNPHDFLRINAVTLTRDGVSIEWRAVPGRVYEVEFSETLEADSWEIIGRYAAEHDGEAASYLDTDSDRRAGYYRTRVSQD